MMALNNLINNMVFYAPQIFTAMCIVITINILVFLLLKAVKRLRRPRYHV